MKKYFIGFAVLLSFTTLYDAQTADTKKVDSLRNLLKEKISFLKLEEKKMTGDVPPDAYNQLDKRRTVNLETGGFDTQNLVKIEQDVKRGKYQLKTDMKLYRNAVGSGGAGSNAKAVNSVWIERGPYNVGGRTRAIMFDPNDTNGKRVFAGGISGGLWKNEDITLAASEWMPINDFLANTSISCITADPNNPQVFYAGTGESMTSDAIGAGVWKTTNGGATWTQIFNPAVTYTSNGRRNGIFYVNDIKVRNNGGVSEVFVGVSGGSVDGTLSGYYDTGLYKSTDGGSSFTRLPGFFLTTSGSTGLAIHHAIQQIEIAADNAVWVSTRTSGFSGINSGGKIFRSTDGTNFTNIYNANIPGSRVQFTLSKTNPAKAYGLLQGSGSTEPVRIIKTVDTGASWVRTGVSGSGLTLPDDVDTGIAPNDFTRGQAFYDLVIAADPENDEVVYTGGIDLFKSVNGGLNWTQISKWSNNNQLAALSVALVHADQHAIVFNPKNLTQMVFGNDGGIYFAPSKNSFTGSSAIPARNTRYNVTQFYDAKMNPMSVIANEEMLAGAQDNGTRRFTGAPQANSFYNTSSFYGGDGGMVEFDDNNAYKISSYVYNYHYLYSNSTSSFSSLIASGNQNQGNFINEMALDRTQDVFFSNADEMNIFQVTGLDTGFLSQTTFNVGIPQTDANGNPIEGISYLKVSPFNPSSTNLYVGTDLGRLFKVTNANTAAPLSTEIVTPIAGTISSISFGTSENQILLTVSNYGQSSVKIYYSTDGGTTWSVKQGNLPDMPVRASFMNPDDLNEVIIGTETGIWQTTNFLAALPTWSKALGNIGTVRVTAFDYRPTTRTLLAATYGRGLYTVQNSVLATSEAGVSTDISYVYPNPSRGNLNLKLKAGIAKVEVKMYDTSGKLVFSKKEVRSDEEFYVKLAKGMYLLTAEHDGERIMSTKVLMK